MIKRPLNPRFSGSEVSHCIYCGQVETDARAESPNGTNHYHESCWEKVKQMRDPVQIYPPGTQGKLL